MAALIGFVRRLWKTDHPPEPPKNADTLRIGLFGASRIAPNAVITPAKSHPEVLIAAIAARDKKKAEEYAKKHKIPSSYGSYQEMLDDPTIDVVYIPLPNSLHYEWAMKALKAGKHVLLEKPFVSNTTEAEALTAYHASLPAPAPILLEAFHYRFHPAWQTFLSLLDPPSITLAYSRIGCPAYFFPKDDIRFNYSLSGGTLMDMGTYAISTLRQVFAAEPIECIDAYPRIMPHPFDQNCDEAWKGSWAFPNGGTGSIDVDLQQSAYGLPWVDAPKCMVKHREVEVPGEAKGPHMLNAGEKHFLARTVTLWNFPAPMLWHRIDVLDEHAIKDAAGTIQKSWTAKESQKAYTWPAGQQMEGQVREGEFYWSTYRYMLEAFVDRIKGRPGSGVWVEAGDSVAQMRVIDGGYEKAGLPIRPTSTYK